MPDWFWYVLAGAGLLASLVVVVRSLRRQCKGGCEACVREDCGRRRKPYAPPDTQDTTK